MPQTEWHMIDECRVSFDVRADASRFIIVRETPRELLAKGLIEGSSVLGGGPHIRWDDGLPKDLRLYSIGLQMLTLWEQMAARLNE